MDKKQCTAALRSMKRRQPFNLTRRDIHTLVEIKKKFPKMTRRKPWCDVVYPIVRAICCDVILPTQRDTGLFNVVLPVVDLIINHGWPDNTWVLRFSAGPDIVANTLGPNPNKWTCYALHEFPEADYSLNQVDAPLRLVGEP